MGAAEMIGSSPAGIQVGRPLAGVRVLAIEQFLSAPFASMLLADAGADVIKVEQPGRGDEYRWEGSTLPGPAGAPNGSFFWRMNRNKRSITLDLSKSDGRELLLGLVAKSDIVLENLKAGSLARLGIDYAALQRANPTVIYLTISGYGHPDVIASPFADRPAFDIIAQGMAGILDVIGQAGGPPLWPQIPVGDIFPGLMGAFAAMLALRGRDGDGRGRRVDLSLYDSLLSLNERVLLEYGITGELAQRGRQHGASPYGIYQAKGGYVVIATVGHSVWLRFCEAIGHPELAGDPRFTTGVMRAKHDEDVLRPLIEAWLAERTPGEAAEQLLKHGVPAGPVQNAADVFDCPHVAARHMLLSVQKEHVGVVKIVGNPIKVAGEPEIPPLPPPDLGADTDSVLGTLLGLDAARIALLRADGVI